MKKQLSNAPLTIFIMFLFLNLLNISYQSKNSNEFLSFYSLDNKNIKSNDKTPPLNASQIHKMVLPYYEQAFEPVYVDKIETNKRIIASPTLNRVEIIQPESLQSQEATVGFKEKPIIYTTVIAPKETSITHSNSIPKNQTNVKANNKMLNNFQETKVLPKKIIESNNSNNAVKVNNSLRKNKEAPEQSIKEKSKDLYLYETQIQYQNQLKTEQSQEKSSNSKLLPGQFSVPVSYGSNNNEFAIKNNNKVEVNNNTRESSDPLLNSFNRLAESDISLIGKSFVDDNEINLTNMETKITKLLQARKTIKNETKELLLRLRSKISNLDSTIELNTTLKKLLKKYQKHINSKQNVSIEQLLTNFQQELTNNKKQE